MPQSAIQADASLPAPPPRTGPLRSGNPRGNPNLAPRCGAHTRAGCPCEAPALRGKQRCRMHGGGSTGPRSPEGLARLRQARTTHGRYATEHRAYLRWAISDCRRGRILLHAISCRDRLPPAFASRLDGAAPELAPLPRPAEASGPMTRAQEREVMQREAEALAPWKQAIAAARVAGRRHAGASLPPAGKEARTEASAPEAHAPWTPADGRQAPAGPNPADRTEPATEAHAPWAPADGRQAPAGPNPADRTEPATEAHAPWAPADGRQAPAGPNPADRTEPATEAHAPWAPADAQQAPAGPNPADRTEPATEAHAPWAPADGRQAPAGPNPADRTEPATEAHAPWAPADAQQAPAGPNPADRTEPATEAHAPWAPADAQQAPAGPNPADRTEPPPEAHAPWAPAPAGGPGPSPPSPVHPPALPPAARLLWPATQQQPAASRQTAHAPWEATHPPAPRPPEGRLRRLLMGGTKLATWTDNVATIGGWLTLAQAVAQAAPNRGTHPTRGP